MWSASITSVAKKNAVSEVIVTFTDGKETVTQTYLVSDPTSLKKIISDQINQYNTTDTFIATNPLGPVDLTVSPPPVLTPDPDQLAQSQFLDDLRTYRGMQNAVALGLLPANDPSISALALKLKTTFLPSYLQLLG